MSLFEITRYRIAFPEFALQNTEIIYNSFFLLHLLLGNPLGAEALPKVRHQFSYEFDDRILFMIIFRRISQVFSDDPNKRGDIYFAEF